MRIVNLNMINYTLSILIVIFSLFSLKPCNGQLIYIPDDNFEQKLIDLGDDDELNDLVFQKMSAPYSL